MTSIVVHIDWIFECETELVELNESKKADSEEEDNKKEKNKRLQTDYRVFLSSSSLESKTYYNFLAIQARWIKEITTPPPQLLV